VTYRGEWYRLNWINPKIKQTLAAYRDEYEEQQARVNQAYDEITSVLADLYPKVGPTVIREYLRVYGITWEDSERMDLLCSILENPPSTDQEKQKCMEALVSPDPGWNRPPDLAIKLHRVPTGEADTL
jgi:hypothetical protein